MQEMQPVSDEHQSTEITCCRKSAHLGSINNTKTDPGSSTCTQVRHELITLRQNVFQQRMLAALRQTAASSSTSSTSCDCGGFHTLGDDLHR